MFALKPTTSQENAVHCNSNHHQSICDRVPNTRTSNPDPSKESTEDDKIKTNQVTTTSDPTGNVKRNSRTVFLQTARAVAYNEANNRSTPVRVLFDNGSQRSYITDNIRLRLGLAPVSKEKLKLNTFGESRYKTQSCEVVKLDLKKPGFDKTITINGLSLPVLCSPLPSRINIDCPHLEGLDLTNDWDQTDGSIDLLVGSDHYWDIVTGETRTGENGPVAVKSSLGWLLSGPVTGTSNNMGAHSNLIISRPAEAYSISTMKTMEKFWNTESIGIKEPDPDNEDYKRIMQERSLRSHLTVEGRTAFRSLQPELYSCKISATKVAERSRPFDRIRPNHQGPPGCWYNRKDSSRRDKSIRECPLHASSWSST